MCFNKYRLLKSHINNVHGIECENVTNNVETHLTRLMRRNRTNRKKEKLEREDRRDKDREIMLSKVVIKDGYIWNPYHEEWFKFNK